MSRRLGSWVGTVALLASVITAGGAGGSPAAAAGPPQCTDPGLVSGTVDNGDGTTSAVVDGAGTRYAATATVTVVVPVGVREVLLDVCGAEGGTAAESDQPPGLGGRSRGTLDVASGAGAVLTVLAGGKGRERGGSARAANGFGGAAFDFEGGGGGLSGVFRSPDLARAGALAVAGGGGGAAGTNTGQPAAGGAGGGSSGADGGGEFPGGGGTQSEPGAGGAAGPDGSDGQPGNGYYGGRGGITSYGGGGGGGGWYGGGGGGESRDLRTGGGGGGSGYVSPDLIAASTSPGVNDGNGVVVLTWATPATPQCTDADLVPGTRDNGDGTTSRVFVGENDSATPAVTLEVPPGVAEVVLDACGAQGQDGEPFERPVPAGGTGGRSTGGLALRPADGGQLTLVVGSRDGSAGFGGQVSDARYEGGRGGGLSGVFSGASVRRAAAVLIAGGGGGGGGGGAPADAGEGAGGGSAGRSGSATPHGQAEPGGPGTQQAPGAGGAAAEPVDEGEPGDGFAGGRGGGRSRGLGGGGGGGGGWYGGGGGGGTQELSWTSEDHQLVGSGGGGGGSGYLSARVSGGFTLAGQHRGQGVVVLTWVTPVPPEFDAAPAGAGLVDEPFSLTGDVGPAVPVATITAAGLPPGLALTDDRDNSYRISGTPTQAGTFAVTLTATSPAGTDRTTGSIRVDRVPELVGTFAGGQVARPYSSSIDVLAAPAATVAVSGGSLPPGLALDQPTPDRVRLHGTPQAAGTYVFTLRAANDAGGRARAVTRQFSVQVSSAPAAPAPPAVVPSPTATPAAPPSPAASPSPAPVGPAVATAPGRFHPVVPARILDTRTGAVLHAAEERVVRVTGTGGVPATGVSAVVLNVTVTGPTDVADLQVFPRGQRPERRTSNLNVRPGETVPVQVTTGVDPDGAVVLSLSAGSAHVVLDVFGWYGDASDPVAGSSGFTALTPRRLLDTRSQVAPVRAGQDRVVPVAAHAGVPADATAVVLNATVLGTPGNADVQIYPAGQAPERRTSNLNVRRGQTRANAVTAALGPDGAISVSVSQAQASVVLDVLGYYSPASSGRFVPVLPARLVDTRLRPEPLQEGADRHQVVGGRAGVPLDAQAALLSVTGTGATAPADLQVFPSGERPAGRTSTLNLGVGQTVANAAYAALGSGGQVGLSLSQGSSHVVLDVYGYFTPG